MYKKILCLSFLGLVLSACKKETSTPDIAAPGSISLEFDNRAGNKELALFGSTYVTASGDSIKLSSLKYYISSIALLKADGGMYALPGGPYLVDELVDASHAIDLEDVPAAEYSGVRFLLGVDSSIAVQNLDTGVFAASKGMRYADKTGPIMLKVQGNTIKGQTFAYWIGGWQDPATRASQWITLEKPANQSMSIQKGRDCELHLFVDILELFAAPTTISIQAEPEVKSPGSRASLMAKNMADAFTINHIHNEAH